MRRLVVASLALVLAGGLVLGYRGSRAGAYGVPTASPGALTYTGTLLTYGLPDNNLHQMSVALWLAGGTSALCTTGATSVQAVNGEFTVALPAACVGSIHGNQNVQVIVTVDGSPLPPTSLAAAPYAIEASSIPATQILTNVGIAASVASSALTIGLTQNDGATWPTATNPAIIGFRSASSTSGALTPVQVASEISVTVPAGASLGLTSGAAQHLYVYAQDSLGAAQLCVSGTTFDEGSVQTSLAISTGATSGSALYCTGGTTGPVRLVGRLLVDEATAGTWATAPSEVSNLPFAAQGAGTTATTTVLTSCKAILSAGLSVGDGLYWIDLDGAGPTLPMQLACDMTNGGWTEVMRQVPGSLLTNTSSTIAPNANVSFRVGNPAITSAAATLAWKLTDATNVVFFKPSCVVDWTKNYVNQPASPCTTGYTSPAFTTAVNGGFINVGTAGIGINNSGQNCSIRALDTGTSPLGQAMDCVYDTAQQIELWFQ